MPVLLFWFLEKKKKKIKEFILSFHIKQALCLSNQKTNPAVKKNTDKLYVFI